MEETKEEKEMNPEMEEDMITEEDSNETVEEADLDELEATELNIETIVKENQQFKTEIENMKDRMLRLQAEYDNYKRRTEKERIAERKYQSEKLAVALLPVMDNFERALQMEVTEANKGFMDGMQMIYQQFREALQAEEITAIEAVDQAFDPNIHQAVMQVEDESKEANTVVEELQKGFMLKDKVIRPAMVKVNK